ncbi:uncharacterized protein RAG0_17550 [Rhynchosporium agropyri]|uniref:Uncharacterized protein n=2 Tax=Rhynchosporium TaxID=38037 RepID=A0A1E1MUU9_RHYSE|nr:uncharacterized protein RAG0_17550 [Rhynchosporium agropyri]CZT52868.1 uncharacterized protein RSE6_14263 [Rhynchosporium secalis]
MQQYTSTSTTATNKSDFIPNPDFCTFKSDITGGRHSSADHRVEKCRVIKATSIEVFSESCQHSVYPMSEGFKIISTKGSDILEIQFYDEVFDVPVDSLGASWAGRSLLFRSGYWIRLLRTGFKGNAKAFRLIDIDAGFVIGGGCCSHGTRPTHPQLRECWEGGILLAEYDGEWKPFFEHMRRQFNSLMWTIIGRHVSRLVWKPLTARKRRGIMQDPLDVVPR